MASLRLQLDSKHPAPRKIDMAVDVLRRDGVAIYPTDTVYAIGASLESRKAAEKLYRLKGMERTHPLAFLCTDIKMAAQFAIINDYAHRMLRRMTPGPYTFVLPASRAVPRHLVNRDRKMGIRISSHPVCLALTEELGQPLLTSSAIPSGEESNVLDVAEAKAAWGDQIDVYLDGDLTPNKPSTVVSLLDNEVEVLREGLGPI